MEQDIIMEAQQGSAKAFGLLVNAYSKRIYHAAYGFLRNMDDATDIVQEVFLRAFKNIATFDVSRPMYPWLYRITKNLCLNKIQHKESRNTGLPEWELKGNSPTPEELTLRTYDEEHLSSALKSLPDNYREILELKHFQDCSYQDIADILGIPIGTVMSRLFNARKKLRKVLEEDDYELHRSTAESTGNYR
ncbi:MAG: sigma-70 family RNA polymerase sigma factor [Spirochaetales bacterium]|nr:sigma-70 family RNA polymerase sigma factor [Spirochaetales bacterium]